MLGKVLSATVLAAAFGVAPALADLAGPAELPPASFKGQQYVDSRGCIFLRAGYGGQVTWVPRVTRDRQQLCGYAPSGGEVAVAPDAPAPQEDAAPAATAAEPAKPAAAAPKKLAAPAKPKPPAARPAAAGGTVKAAGYRLACPASTPVAERFAVYGGGTKLLCTTGNGSLEGANFPILVAGSVGGAAAGGEACGAADAPMKATKSAKYPDMTPPPGYKLAWTDGRLNPNRGKQTVEGFLVMDEIWTRTSPAELREDSAASKRPVTVIVRHKDGSETAYPGYVLSTKNGKKVVKIAGPAVEPVAKSTKTAPTEAVKKAEAAKAEAGGRFLVQVGTFGVPANAEGVAGRLRALGLPVARGKLKGGALTVVYAGPFTGADQAKAALTAARGAGFADAVILR